MKVLITGGAGFIGCNAANRYLSRGHEVVILDNLSRPRTEHNLEWLRSRGTVRFVNLDIADTDAVEETFQQHRDVDFILHLAGQVAVTTSVRDPRGDFMANALGTFNLLEAARKIGTKAPFLYSSTNKVYGGLDDVGVKLENKHYRFESYPEGITESTQLDFHSPYGCSKGAADQYVRDYYRIFGLNTIVFRQSCIYGYRQFGLEDQGWVAWFTIASQLDQEISVYGDGMQVRDVLFVDDLLDAYDSAIQNPGKSLGQVYNVGGGRANTISLLDLLGYLETKRGKPLSIKWSDWRPGDQRVFISDNSKARSQLNWNPGTSWKQGIDKLYGWVEENIHLFTGSPA